MKVRFCDLFLDETKNGFKIKAEEYLENGKYPIVDQGNNSIAGYTNLEKGIFENIPVIIFGDHTRVIKYIDMPFFLGADGVKILKIKLNNVLPKYLFYYLKNVNIPDTGYNRHFKWLKELNFEIPNLKIQNNIVNILDRITTIISLRQRQLKKLDELVKSRFIEMFGDVIHNSKKWQNCLFSEITSSRLGKMLDAKQQTGRNSYPYLANFNVQWFRFNLKNLNKMDFDEKDRSEFELCEGDLLVCEGGEIGRCAVWHNELQPCFFQKALHRVRCNRQIILPDYLSWWFRYNCDYGGFAALASSKATIAHLPGTKLKQLQVVVPPVELQEQFVAFVKKTDKSKLEIQKSLDKLEILKKSLMQQYFG